jgi:hypothetical protein
MAFTRRFTSFPDAATLREIEGVVIVDSPPSGGVQEADSGTVALLGEFEDGGFATDPAVPADVYHPAGGLIAISRDKYVQTVGGLGYTVNGVRNKYPIARIGVGEAWNGNAFVQSRGLGFRRLYAVRVDTSIGSVTLAPIAYLESAGAAPWALSTGQTVIANVDGGADVTATFTGAAASVTGVGGTFTGIVAGDYVDLAIDGNPNVRVTFQASDTTVAAVVARINAAFGYALASVATGQVKLDSSIGGTSSKIVIGAGGAIAKLGLTAATTNGSGNVANIAAVTLAEAVSILGALTGATARATAAGKVRLASKTGSTGTIKVKSTGTATAFGFALDIAQTVAASSGKYATSIPAGTVCNSGGSAATRIVTMQTLAIPAGNTGAASVKVRPAEDDGTFATLVANSINTIETTPSTTAEFVVSQPNALSGALSDAAKDAAYLAALNKTLSYSGPARKVNYVVSARQSAAVRLALKQNALDGSGSAYGRKAIVSPPLGTTLATATGSAAPGVGAYRNERVFYTFGWQKFIPEIAAAGAAGGIGFNDAGIVEVHGDVVLASLCSLLNPEENPAQATDFIPAFYVGVEGALSAWDIDDYKAAKAAGICAPVFDEVEGAQFQSGVTSVDPLTSPSQVPMARVRLADFLTDSVAEFQRKYVKKLGTERRKDQLLGDLQSFLDGLVSAERVAANEVSQGEGPRRTFVLRWKVEPLDSMETIVNETSIGEGAIETRRTA